MKKINKFVESMDTLHHALNYIKQHIIRERKSARLLTLAYTPKEGLPRYFVDTTPILNEQLHVVWPKKYVVLKTYVAKPKRVLRPVDFKRLRGLTTAHEMLLKYQKSLEPTPLTSDERVAILTIKDAIEKLTKGT